MNRLGLATWGLLVSALLGSSPAAAQPSTGTVFIGGSALAALEYSPSYDGYSNSYDSLSGLGGGAREGTVAAGSLAVGVHLTERVSARFEWSLTDSLKNSQDFAVNPLGLGGELTSVSTGFNFGSGLVLSPSLTTASQSIESKRTTAAGFSLLGFHLGRGRTSLELVAGLGLLRQTVRTRYRSTLTGPGLFGTLLPIPDVNSKSSGHFAVAVVGADAAVSLTEHAAIVPHLRLYALNGGLSVRPGLGLRWTF